MNTNSTDTDYQIVPLNAFNDNYIWLLRRGDRAALIDPGDAAPVLAYLDRQQLNLCAILATHHHGDPMWIPISWNDSRFRSSARQWNR
jgi:hydroxyacylglutathione hydrolase